MRRSRPLSDIFEECLEKAFDGQSIDECLKSYPDKANELRPLIETALAAKKAVMAAVPSTEFRERARQQLYAAQRDMSTKAAKRRWISVVWQPAWAMSVAAALLVMIAGAGTVLAANNSMPDQPLYGVKHTVESARLLLTRSADAKADLYASLADQRVQEILYLAGKEDARRIERSTRDLGTYLNGIAEVSGGVPQTMMSSSKAGGAESATGNQGSAANPSLAAPAVSSPVVTPAPSSTSTNDSGAEKSSVVPPATTRLAPGIAAAPVYGTAALDTSPKAQLRARILQQSAQDMASLMSALETASPDAKPALLNAIAVLQSGYEKALQSLQTP
jgi:hypothetical protein